MLDFFKKMFSDSGEVSSKRFAGILALLIAIVLGFVDTYGHKVSEPIFNSFLLYSAGALGLTIADNFIKSNKE
jgi:formate hydrogenlyase subunit 3/multisubunit Na+/H+ antiporter MnhD subunit